MKARADVGIRVLEMAFYHPALGGPVAHAQRDNEGVWEFRISTGAMASGSIDETCRRQTLENVSDAQAREALDRLGHAVVAACVAAVNRKRDTADALRKAVAESATPPLFHT